jgi:folate-binding protein YgfZ
MVIFRSKVEVADASGDFAVVASFGHAIADAARSNATELSWQDPWMNDPKGSVRYAEAGGREAWPLYLNLIARHELDRVLAGYQLAGSLAFDALRVAAHRPWQPNELDEKTLPHELDWLSSAVHLTKGCYRGQETVAKVHNLGHPPRRLVLLHLDGTAERDAVAGDSVWQGERELGRITTVAQHFELGPIALAVVARTADDSADWLARSASDEAGQPIAAKAQTIVPPTAGAAAGMREKRSGLLG